MRQGEEHGHSVISLCAPAALPWLAGKEAEAVVVAVAVAVVEVAAVVVVVVVVAVTEAPRLACPLSCLRLAPDRALINSHRVAWQGGEGGAPVNATRE